PVGGAVPLPAQTLGGATEPVQEAVDERVPHLVDGDTARPGRHLPDLGAGLAPRVTEDGGGVDAVLAELVERLPGELALPLHLGEGVGDGLDLLVRPADGGDGL